MNVLLIFCPVCAFLTSSRYLIHLEEPRLMQYKSTTVRVLDGNSEHVALCEKNMYFFT